MNQAIFLILLYLIGLLAGWCWKNHLPPLFIVLSGFLWGLLLWVITATIIWTLPGAVNTGVAILIIALIGLVCFVLNWRLGHWHLQKSDQMLLVGGVAVFSLLAFLFVSINLSTVTVDGLTMITNGTSFGRIGFNETNTGLLNLLVLFTMAVHGAAPMLGESYSYAVQPMLSVSLILNLAYAIYHGIMLQGGKSRLAVLFAILALALMLTSFMVRYALTYVHANLSAGTYLLVALVSLWFADTESNDAWLAPFTAALIAFALLRVEAPIFSIVYLAVMLSLSSLSIRSKIWSLITFSLVVGIWFIYIFLVVQPENHMSSLRILLLIVLPLINLWVLMAMLRTSLGKRRLQPILARLILVSCVSGVLVLFFVYPKNISGLFVGISLLDDWWGLLWVVFLIMLLTPLPGEQLPAFVLLNQMLILGLVLIVAAGIITGGYRLGWDGSGNRMLLHLFPTLIFAIAVKYGTLRS